MTLMSAKHANMKYIAVILLVYFVFSFAARAQTKLAIEGVCPDGYMPETYSKVTEMPITCKPAAANVAPTGKVTQQVSGYQLSVDIPCDPKIAGGECPRITGPASYVARLYQFGLMIAGLLAFASIIYGSVKYILSAGNLSSMDEAKEQITQAIYGLLLLLGAYIILYTINPALVQLRNPNVPPLNIEEIIKRGKYQPGKEQLLTGGETGTGAGGDQLCTAGSYPGLSIRLGGKEIVDQRFFCSQCVDGASKDENGKCQCNPGTTYSGEVGYCTTVVNPQNGKCPQGFKLFGTLCVAEKR